MKKFLLSAAALLFTLGASAQAFTVTVDGNPVENGATVYSDHYNNDAEWLDPELYVTTEEDATLYVDLQNTGDTMIMFCWPSSCRTISGGNSFSINGSISGGVATDLQLHAMPMDDPFDATCNITLYLEGDEDNYFELTINMHYDSDVAEISAADDAAPVYYNLQGVEVANPENGIFIRRQGNKVTKVAL